MIIRTLLKILKFDALQMIPATGIDMVKALIRWYSEIDTVKKSDEGSNEQIKRIKMLKNLVSIMC